MKSFLILSLAALLLTACGQKTDISEVTTETATEQNSPIIPAPSAGGKEIEAKTTEATNIEIADDEEPIGTIAKTGFTASEVAEHSTPDDCWLILEGKVYEVTEFIPSHPGGKAILKGCGKDATQMFAGHPESAKAMKEKYYIGDLKS
jgi:cytochrome b involved in lipid metabolism